MSNASLTNKTATTIFTNTTKQFVLINTTVAKPDGEYFFEGNGECPKWVVYGFLTFFFLGSCVNLLETFALLRCKKNGVLSIILQITLTDVILFFVAIPELFSSYYQTWKFSSQTCMLYIGTETLANTLILYLLVCLNFHIITFWNLHNIEIVKNNKNPLTSFNESSSSECLVTRSENRIVTIDYRKRKNDVPVTFPIIFLWILCLSVSMPKYVLSSTVEMQERTLCVVLQNVYGKVLHCLLLIFSVTLPCFLLLVSVLILIYKLCKSSQKDIDNVLTKQFDEIRCLLKFSIVLTVFYMITTCQRHIFNTTITIREFFILENYYYNNFSNVYQIMLHYSGTGLRGIICYFAIPNMRQAIGDKLFFCNNKETS